MKTQGSPSATVANTSVDQETGRFDLRGIDPGSYDLFASANIGDKEYLTKVPVEIRGRDVEDLEVILQPGAEIKGRMLIDGGLSNLQLARSGMGMVRIGLRRKDGLFGDIIRPDIDERGSAFIFRNVPPGDYDITVRFVADRGQSPSPDLYVADIRAAWPHRI